MKRTSERHAPELASASTEGLLLDVRHRFAYEVACGYATGRAKALDVGSGEGYGSTILSKAVDSYRGVDISREAVEHANNRYGSDTVRFDVLRRSGELPYESESFDLIVSFQVIEHVADVGQYVSEIRRVSRLGATVLVTTPNRATRLKPGERPWNRFHLREYDSRDLAEIFGSAFSSVELWGVRGSKAYEALEAGRVARARRWARLDVMGLRHRLPSRVDQLVRSALRPIGASREAITAAECELRLDPDGIDASIDLLVLARP
jgi:SAM-dependent methyltransferase